MGNYLPIMNQIMSRNDILFEVSTSYYIYSKTARSGWWNDAMFDHLKIQCLYNNDRVHVVLIRGR